MVRLTVSISAGLRVHYSVSVQDYVCMVRLTVLVSINEGLFGAERSMLKSSTFSGMESSSALTNTASWDTPSPNTNSVLKGW